MNAELRLVSPDLLASMLAVSAPLLHKTPLDVLAQAVPAEFIIASIAWIRAAIINGEFFVVLTLTYVIAVGDFTHVIAGGAETFLLLFAGQIEISYALESLITPALLGNVIGGTGLFALLAYAQVRQELSAVAGVSCLSVMPSGITPGPRTAQALSTASWPLPR